MTSPVVSIIIPTRNCVAQLACLLGSLERQTFRDFEVIVVDNFSSDGTDKLTSGRAHVFQKGPERHQQRAFGASCALGRYLMFLDADMELDDSLIAECVQLVQNGNDAVIIPERGGGRGFWTDCQKLEKQCYWNDPWMEVANRFIRAEVYQRVGGYRTDLIAGEDFELHDRLVRGGAKIARCSAMITHYEDRRFWKVVRKKFYYGSQMQSLFREHPVENIRRFTLLKPAYIRNWELLLSHPCLAAGLAMMKGVQFLAGMLGLLKSLICRKNHRTPAGLTG